MAVHFIQKYGMMAFKIPSKWEHRRLTRALAAKPIMALGAVQPDELGHCDFVETKQIGGRSVTVFRQEGTVGKGKQQKEILKIKKKKSQKHWQL